MVAAAMKLKDACSLEESYDQPRQHIKKQRHFFANKGPSSQGYGFSCGHVWMWELDCEEGWDTMDIYSTVFPDYRSSGDSVTPDFSLKGIFLFLKNLYFLTA